MAEDKDTTLTENPEQNAEVKEDITEDTTAANAAEETACGEEERSSRAEKKKLKKLEAELSEKEKKLEAKEKEISELNDKYMRMMAEYDNFRKRSAKEKDSIYADAYSDAISNILPILDNLERASAFSDAESVAKGVQMTLKGATEAFEKMGVQSFGESGEQFDPDKHNAVMHVEDESLGEGVIVEVFQKGYVKGDKIIRYAMVKVAN